MPRRNSVTQAISPEEFSQSCVHMTSYEQYCFAEMLKLNIKRDKKLGITSSFIKADGDIIFKRDATSQQGLDNYNIHTIEKEQWEISGLNYAIALHQLIEASDSHEKETLHKLIHTITLAYQKENASLSPNKSYAQLRESFIRDRLAPFMLDKQLCISGNPITSIHEAVNALDNASRLTRLSMLPCTIETTNSVMINGQELGYRRIKKPLTALSQKLRDEYQKCLEESDRHPPWFKSLSNPEQAQIQQLVPTLCEGLYQIPSQMRAIPGIKNAWLNKIQVKNTAEEFFSVSENFHAATSVPMISGLGHEKIPGSKQDPVLNPKIGNPYDDEETVRLTRMAFDTIKDTFKFDFLSMGLLVSRSGDSALELQRKIKNIHMPVLFDQKACYVTQAATKGLEHLGSFITPVNDFRYNETDEINDICLHVDRISQTLNIINNKNHERIVEIKNHIANIVELIDIMKKRVKHVTKSAKKILGFDQILLPAARAFIKTKTNLNLRNSLVIRILATNKKGEKTKNAAEKIDGDLKSVRLLSLYSQLIFLVNTLKKNKSDFSKKDQEVIQSLEKSGLGFGCMSGNNRTQHVNHMMDVMSVFITAVKQNIIADTHENFQIILKAMSNDFTVQVATDFGGTPGALGIRSKSCKTANSDYKGMPKTVALLHAPFSDTKSIDATLTDIRQWLHTCYRYFPSKKQALKSIESLLTEEFDNAIFNEDALKNASEKLKKLYKNIYHDCQSDSILKGLNKQLHPDWFELQHKLKLEQKRYLAAIKIKHIRGTIPELPTIKEANSPDYSPPDTAPQRQIPHRALAVTLASPDTTETLPYTDSSSEKQTDPFDTFLKEIASFFYEIAFDLKNIFEEIKSNVHSFFSASSERSSRILTNSNSHKSATPAKKMKLKLPSPENGFQKNQAHEITLTVKENHISYVDIPGGNLHAKHANALLNAVAHKGKTSCIKLTGILDQDFIKTLAHLNQQREEPFIIDNQTDNTASKRSNP